MDSKNVKQLEIISYKRAKVTEDIINVPIAGIIGITNLHKISKNFGQFHLSRRPLIIKVTSLSKSLLFINPYGLFIKFNNPLRNVFTGKMKNFFSI